MEVIREKGVVIGVISAKGFHPKAADNPHWTAFVEANAKKAQPEDISDHAPEPPAEDQDETRFKVVRNFLTKTTPATATDEQNQAYIRALGVLVLRALGKRDE